MIKSKTNKEFRVEYANNHHKRPPQGKQSNQDEQEETSPISHTKDTQKKVNLRKKHKHKGQRTLHKTLAFLGKRSERQEEGKTAKTLRIDPNNWFSLLMDSQEEEEEEEEPCNNYINSLEHSSSLQNALTILLKDKIRDELRTNQEEQSKGKTIEGSPSLVKITKTNPAAAETNSVLPPITTPTQEQGQTTADQGTNQRKGKHEIYNQTTCPNNDETGRLGTENGNLQEPNLRKVAPKNPYNSGQKVRDHRSHNPQDTSTWYITPQDSFRETLHRIQEWVTRILNVAR